MREKATGGRRKVRLHSGNLRAVTTSAWSRKAINPIDDYVARQPKWFRDKFVLSAWRIGQRWGATRAPKRMTVRMGRVGYHLSALLLPCLTQIRHGFFQRRFCLNFAALTWCAINTRSLSRPTQAKIGNLQADFDSLKVDFLGGRTGKSWRRTQATLAA